MSGARACRLPPHSGFVCDCVWTAVERDLTVLEVK